MKSFFALGATLFGLSVTSVSGAVLKAEPLGVVPAPIKGREIASLGKRQGCTNGPTSRDCWSDGFDIDTDMYTSWPNTGRVVEETLTITNTTCNPDDNDSGGRICMLINGRMPGPVIRANWGDTLRIHVTNNLQFNGTSIHWHGIRMLNHNIQDGVNGITECALAPGDTKTYEFQVTEYGTTWYHSHFSAQYGEGTFGTIIIDGPATANYDLDLGTYTVQDWYYTTAYFAAWQAFDNGQRGLGPPVADNILINGTAKNGDGGGAWSQVTLTPGRLHRLRLVNPSVDSAYRISLDNHNFTVIATDFVPIEPYNTSYIQLGIGQRYDVIINATQDPGNYWFRAVADPGCFSNNVQEGRAIFTYEGEDVADPTTTAWPNPPAGCNDPKTTPNIVKDVPSEQFANQAKTLPVNFENTTVEANVTTNGQNLILWTVNGTSMIIDPGKPTVEYVAEGNNSFPESYNVVSVAPDAQWTYWIIQQAVGSPPLPHPIHLHGHDMYVLGSGTGQFNVDDHLASLTFTNPPRRDVTHLPGNGWLVIAYPTDNPGAWLMHCHIAFHVSMGLSVQFLEREDEIAVPEPDSEFFDTCQNWAEYQAGRPPYPQDDSGLKRRWPPLMGPMGSVNI